MKCFQLIQGTLFTISLVTMMSCGGPKSESTIAPPPPPDTEMAKSDSVAGNENHTASVDTTIRHNISIPEHAMHVMTPAKRSARMAYSYCPEMKRNEAADVNVYVSIVNPTSVVVDNLMHIVEQQHNPATGKKDVDSIIATNILLYRRMKVELIDPESAFKVTQVYGEQWQEVDSMGDNRWRWSVVPQTDAKEAKLIIKVVAETPEGVVKDIDDRTFYVKVKLANPDDVVRSWWSYLTDNPAMVITVILIPLIAFFGKRYFDRKAKR